MDIMHDLLEGSLQYEVKELLKHVTSNRLITLAEVNNAIESFPYGSSDIVDKPSPIASTTLLSEDNRLKQSGKWEIGVKRMRCNNYNSALCACVSCSHHYVSFTDVVSCTVTSFDDWRKNS